MTAIVRGRRRGAPAKPPEMRRRRVVTVRLTDAEHAAVTKAARAAGRALGRHLRESAFGRQAPTVPPINMDAWSQLGRWAGAMTTIANAAAGERLTDFHPDLVPILEGARAELHALRMALLGKAPGRRRGGADP